MGKKSDKKNKATESSKEARKALKEGLAKPAVEVSEHALEGELPEWNAALDELREADLAQGMNAKAVRVQRQQRIRLLKKGKELPAHGGLNELQQPEVVEPVIASDTEADDEPMLFDEEDNAAAIAAGLPEGEAMAQYVVEAAAEERPLSKKERKALAAAQERAEADRKAAAKAAKKAAKGGTVAVTQVEQYRRNPEPETADEAEYREDSKTNPEFEEPAKPARRDNSLITLQTAQARADETGKKQKVVMPRKYRTKNYGVKLVAQYTTKDPSLVLSYKGDDEFNEDTGDFSVTLIVAPKK